MHVVGAGNEDLVLNLICITLDLADDWGKRIDNVVAVRCQYDPRL